jgi:glutamine amidotransferase
MITIVDYQMGNLRSVQKAFERVGAAARFCNRPEEVACSEKLVLPGVGAFGDAMRELAVRGLVDPLRDFIASGRPFLGICLGMQLLFESSEESPGTPGLGVFSGSIQRLRVPLPLKVPHMGWNQVEVCRPSRLWSGLPSRPYFYFVHSYVAVPEDRSLVGLTFDYSASLCAGLCREMVFATQFHPEKSQADGLRLLANFAGLDESR